MLSTEKAFDLLPHGVTILEKLNFIEYVKENKVTVKTEKEKKELEHELVVKAIIYIVKNANKIKSEVFEMVSIFTSKSVEEVKKQSIVTTIGEFKELLGTEELFSFFKQAMQ